jgi:peptidoglycan-N-acetylglucosamine deacetylase
MVAGNTGGASDARIAPRLLAGIRPGSIVVLHEGNPERRGVVATTDELLGALAARGMRAVTVSDLAAG